MSKLVQLNFSILYFLKKNNHVYTKHSFKYSLTPVGVLLEKGLGTAFLINILLTILGWFPGVIHAFYVATR
jgi:uncharacterized membrane protein YqaE (UPF0057 family)